MSKLETKLKIEVVAIAICPVVQSKFGRENEFQTAEPLKTLIKIDAFNEMIELYNEKHKDDDKNKSEVICKIDASSLDPYNNINTERSK